MEVVAGLSFTAFREGANLPARHQLTWPSDASKKAWQEVWHIFHQLGLDATTGANIKPGAPVGASQPGIAAEASHSAHDTEEHRLASNAQSHTGQDLMTLCGDDRRGIWNMAGSSPGAATGAFQLGEAAGASQPGVVADWLAHGTAAPSGASGERSS